MNIFHLDRDLEKSARYHIDKHVVKMIVEHTQLMSCASRLSGLDEGYKITHVNHPCAIWTRASLENWLYVRDLTRELHKEWQYRYGHPKGRKHKSFELMENLSVPDLPRIGWTLPPKCMPPEVQLPGVVASYRNYYRVLKVGFATYTKRPVPKFMTKD